MHTDNTPASGPDSAANGEVPPVIAPPQIHTYVLSPVPTTPKARGPGQGKATAGFVVLSAVLLTLILFVVGVTGYFRLSSPAAALRTSVMSAVPGEWDKTVALRVGWFTTGMVRAGSRLFEMPPEPRAALDALRGAEVGVYRLKQDAGPADFTSLLANADGAMQRRGWDRIVGVVEKGQVVAVYFPHRKVTFRGIKCCVVVLHGRDLVVASASGNLEPLIKIAEQHLDTGELRRCLQKGIYL